MNHQKKKNRLEKTPHSFTPGFTLIEALVAATILSLAAAGPLTVAHRSLITASEARDQITANYLAQEAVELVRNLRDQNNLKNDGNWLRNLGNCDASDPCGIDVTQQNESEVVRSCNSFAECKLQTNATYGYYSHETGSGWLPTKFKRMITIEERTNNASTDNREADVKVTVEWSSRLVGIRRVVIDTKIFKRD